MNKILKELNITKYTIFLGILSFALSVLSGIGIGMLIGMHIY